MYNHNFVIMHFINMIVNIQMRWNVDKVALGNFIVHISVVAISVNIGHVTLAVLSSNTFLLRRPFLVQ
jgi:hypothetical protein